MNFQKILYQLGFSISLAMMCLVACKSNRKKSEHFANTVDDLKEKTTTLINGVFQNSKVSDVLLKDSNFVLKQSDHAARLYTQNSFTAFWMGRKTWLPIGDSLFVFIKEAELFGLFPEDYHLKSINEIRDKFITDSLGKTDRNDAALWAKADMLMTDAIIQIINDIKLGRLPNDSVSLRKDSTLTTDFIQAQFNAILTKGLYQTIHNLEPKQPEYVLLRSGIKKFLETADYRAFTIVPYPEKNVAKFKQLLQKRLYEGGYLSNDSTIADSAQLAAAVKLFQQAKGITIDGVAGEGTVRMLNSNDREKFIRIAISLDKYKLLPEEMPAQYIWVNTSANYLQLMNGTNVELLSKVICGKPKTRTPLLNSAVSVIITYPQWVPPPSIVGKEILPAVKKNPGYLSRKGFSLLDSKGNEVDPYSVDWSKYSRGVPYRIVQGSGDANSLGIMKFYFDNNYSVYLHDTNQRYLFSNAMRSLSHGCVRVQEWKQLAFYLLRNDSISNRGTNYTRIDSVQSWLSKKQKRNISIKNKMPLFIRNVTCEGRNGSILFYDDIYGEDKMIRERYFATK